MINKKYVAACFALTALIFNSQAHAGLLDKLKDKVNINIESGKSDGARGAESGAGKDERKPANIAQEYNPLTEKPSSLSIKDIYIGSEFGEVASNYPFKISSKTEPSAHTVGIQATHDERGKGTKKHLAVNARGMGGSKQNELKVVEIYYTQEINQGLLCGAIKEKLVEKFGSDITYMNPTKSRMRWKDQHRKDVLLEFICTHSETETKYSMRLKDDLLRSAYTNMNKKAEQDKLRAKLNAPKDTSKVDF